MKHDSHPDDGTGSGGNGAGNGSNGAAPGGRGHDSDSGMADEDDGRDLFADVERRALYDMPDDDDDDDDAPDLVGSLSATDGVATDGVATDDSADADTAAAARDVTLGGYIEKHDRVPAFDGSDGQPYTVDIDVEEAGDDEGPAFVGFLIFIRWAATGAGIMDHLESGDIARGATEEDARRGVLDLSLYEIKAELDAAIARRREALED
jgi:hypothetical protein